MCTEHHDHRDGRRADGSAARPTEGGATRRSFVMGGVGTLAATVAFGVWGADTAAAGAGELGPPDSQDAATSEAAEPSVDDSEPLGPPAVPGYRNRPSWGANEALRLTPTGQPDYPMAFYPVQKIVIHHTATRTPASEAESVDLVRAVYREHVSRDFGDIGYHLLIDPFGTVFEGRYSGGTQFPLYDTYPGSTADGPRLVNAAHTYNFNAGNVGIAMVGDFDDNDVSEAAWAALQCTVAMICANTGLDPQGQSLYRNPINGVERVLPNVVAHRNMAGTYCPGAAILDRFEELVSSAAELAQRLGTDCWLA